MDRRGKWFLAAAALTAAFVFLAVPAMDWEQGEVDAETTYTVIWQDDDGTELHRNYCSGGMPEIPDPSLWWGSADCIKSDDNYNYYFSGWTPEVTEITEDTTYTVVYRKAPLYTVSWYNESGGLISSDKYEYGAYPYCEDEPSSIDYGGYTYTFGGWEPEIQPVTCDTAYTATFYNEYHYYDITWYDGNNEYLYSESFVYGSLVDYKGPEPTKTDDSGNTYVFTGWYPELGIVSGETCYYAQFKILEFSTITWTDDEGNVLHEESVENGTIPTYPYGAPTKSPQDNLQYVFSCWSPAPSVVSGNQTYKAVFTSETRMLNVSWTNPDGSIISTNTVEYGSIPSYDGPVPTFEGPEYEYTFKGWSPGFTNVYVDTSYVAEYDTEIRYYDITWYNYDGTVAEVDRMAYGSDIGMECPYPEKPSDETYMYVHYGWTPEIVNVVGDAEYHPLYYSVKLHTITWMDGDKVLGTDRVGEGYVPVYTGTTPVRESTVEHSFEFTDWSPSIVPVTGDETYYAQYTQKVRMYTITWLYDSGDFWNSCEYPYGAYPEMHGPSKESDGIHTYEFSGWTPDVTVVTEDASYKAVYKSTLIERYSVTWKDWDGTILYTTDVVAGSLMPSYPYPEPVRGDDDHCTYSFYMWYPDYPSEVTGDFTTYAGYMEHYKSFNITWLDSNGSPIHNDCLEYNQPINHPRGPDKESDSEYAYVFSHWDPREDYVTGDRTFKPVYDEIPLYSVKWFDADGKILNEEIIMQGETPTYSDNPSKEMDDQYTYEFVGWDKEYVPITEDTEFHPVYTKTLRTYDVLWNVDGWTFHSVVLEYGSVPIHPETVPDNQFDGVNHYRFTGWSGELRSIEGPTTFTAQFEPIPKYNVTWMNSAEEFLYSYEVLEGDVPEYPFGTPTMGSDGYYEYTFNRWDKEYAPTYSDITYTAVYDRVALPLCTVTWKNWDGTVLYTVDVPVGSMMPEYPYGEPSRPADKSYIYWFDAWHPYYPGTVTEDFTTYAGYWNEAIPYELRWYDCDGNEWSQATYEYGAEIHHPDGPYKGDDEDYRYVFSHWDPQIEKVEGDHMFTPVYDTIPFHTVTWMIPGASEQKTVLLKGDMPSTPYVPETYSDDDYRYTFTGWNPEIAPVSGDVTYTPVYAKTALFDVTWKYGESTYHGKVAEGETPQADFTMNPIRENPYIYEFTAWSPVPGPVHGDVVYTAVLKETLVELDMVFTVTGGSVKTGQSVSIYFDAAGYDIRSMDVVIAYDTSVFTFADDRFHHDYELVDDGIKLIGIYGGMHLTFDVSEDADAGDYTFTAYMPEGSVIDVRDFGKPVPVFEDGTVKVSLQTYTVTFSNGTGSVTYELERGETIVPPETPTREDDGEYHDYVFKHWVSTDGSILGDDTVCTGNVVYTPVFEGKSNFVTITWVVEGDATTSRVRLGEIPTNVDAWKRDDKIYKYTFAGWSPEPVAAVEDATYTAVFEKTLRT